MTVNPAHTALWPAPHASGAVDATVQVPGSKSVTNRALVLAALASEPGWLRRPLRSRDTLLMAGALRALGVGIEEGVGPDGTGEFWRVIPAGLHGPATVDVGNAGTVMRFLPPVAALADGPVRFDGDPRSYERPLHGVIDALRVLGARIDDDGRGALPLTVHGSGALDGGPVEIDASSSSQFVSALLLSGPRFNQGVEVRHTGSTLPSMPHIRITVDMLRGVGAQVDTPESGGEPNVWRVTPGGLPPRPGPDGGAGPVQRPAVPGGGPGHRRQGADPRLAGPHHPARRPAARDLHRDGRFLPTDRLRAGVHRLRRGARHRRGPLRGGASYSRNIAAVAALADSPSTLRGVAHLRLHETDRLAALTKEINELGGDVTETADGLHIRPRPLHGGVFHTYDDHRMATAGAIIGLVVEGVRIENVATTAKTLPDFPELWTGMLGA
ncbi:3-phosphoshikimate 1-carboxyvinyltransferase OS=Streptomyces fumanus OX=67302 GN=aroA1 PE=3 SV=1 [Streptomyces fumanus]